MAGLARPIIVCVALLGALGAPRALLAMDFVFLGFGDSITLSTACPVDCSTEFDEAGLGGYVGRLDTRLGAGYKVENHGVGGESTGEGLTRIDSVLNGGGDVLLLMEGTNDISSGFSTETITANLEAMIDKATAKGIDTVLSSTIRRMNLPGHGPTSSLRGAIDNLASDKERDFVNPYGPLCPILDCFDEHYYQPDQLIGHIDASGYEIMTDLWEEVIRDDSTPGVPTLVTPMGEINEDLPTFEWDHLTAANWYQIQVDEEGGSRVLDAMVDATADCSAGTCSWTPASALPEGDLEWRVRARNLIAYGAWSAWTDFTVAIAFPGPVTLIEPTGDFYSVTPLTFLYEWNEALDSDDYNLRVLDENEVLLINTTFSASVCSGGTCAGMPGTSLGAGEYTWKVRGVNDVGNGPWSPTLPIGIYSTTPKAVGLVSPEGDSFQSEPTYRWDESAGATGYELVVQESDGTEVLSRNYGTGLCSGDNCESTPAVVLDPGDYRWRMRASNPLGDGTWSPFMDFTVLECSNPKNITISNETVNGERTFAACGTLTVSDGVLVRSGGTATFLGGEEVVLEDGLEVEDGGTIIVKVDSL